MDVKLAERTAKHLADFIVKTLKIKFVKQFQDKIQGENRLFQLKTIIKDVENYLLAIVDGKITPNPFQIKPEIEKTADGKFMRFIKRILFISDEEEKYE